MEEPKNEHHHYKEKMIEKRIIKAFIPGLNLFAVPDVTKKLILWHKYKNKEANTKEPKQKRGSFHKIKITNGEIK